MIEQRASEAQQDDKLERRSRSFRVSGIMRSQTLFTLLALGGGITSHPTKPSFSIELLKSFELEPRAANPDDATGTPVADPWGSLADPLPTATPTPTPAGDPLGYPLGDEKPTTLSPSGATATPTPMPTIAPTTYGGGDTASTLFAGDDGSGGETDKKDEEGGGSGGGDKGDLGHSILKTVVSLAEKLLDKLLG